VVRSNGCREREVIEFCQERLANFKVPRIVEFRDEIPRSPLGKILRKYLV
jgi:long-chain acyl-CoA synthetase